MPAHARATAFQPVGQLEQRNEDQRPALMLESSIMLLLDRKHVLWTKVEPQSQPHCRALGDRRGALCSRRHGQCKSRQREAKPITTSPILTITISFKRHDRSIENTSKAPQAQPGRAAPARAEAELRQALAGLNMKALDGTQ